MLVPTALRGRAKWNEMVIDVDLTVEEVKLPMTSLS